jgi:hypothetical protein
MKVEPHKLSRDVGDGASDELEELRDEERFRTNGMVTDTATTFSTEDINSLDVSPQKKRHFRRLKQRQEGYDRNESRQQKRQREAMNREEDKRRAIGTYATYLGASDHQRRRAMHILVDVLDIEKNFGSYNTEQIAFGVLNVVIQNQDERLLTDEDAYTQLRSDLELSASGAARIRQTVRELL